MKLYTEEQLRHFLHGYSCCNHEEISTDEYIGEECVSKIEINDNVINHVMNDDTIEKLVLCETGHDIKRYNNGK